MSRQIVYRRFGAPAEVLEVEDVDDVAPGPGEVVVALAAAPIHLVDLKHIAGEPWFDGLVPPQVPGYEGVGRVCALGPDVTRWAVGDRVFLPARFGAWRERTRLSADAIWWAPEGISDEQLALVPINLSTAYLMLRSIVAMSPGDWFIQNAANSNVGYYLIRLAKRLGLHSVNVVRRAELIPGLAEAGGDLNLLDSDTLAADVKAQVPDGRLKLAIDAVAGDAPTRLGQCFGRVGGTIASYGMLSGQPCTIPPEMLIMGGITLTGFATARAWAKMSPQALDAMREELNAFLVADPPRTPIAGVYGFSQIAQAVDHAARTGADRAGKVILKPDL